MQYEISLVFFILIQDYIRSLLDGFRLNIICYSIEFLAQKKLASFLVKHIFEGNFKVW